MRWRQKECLTSEWLRVCAEKCVIVVPHKFRVGVGVRACVCVSMCVWQHAGDGVSAGVYVDFMTSMHNS